MNGGGSGVDPGPTGQSGDAGDRFADERDRRADERSTLAESRDDRAKARDDRAEARDRADDRVDVRAASDRADARRDRSSAASDRADAAADREASSSERVRSAADRAVSSVDGLTGVHRRDAGVVELERDMAKAKRAGQSFLLAFVDVDGLKATNDSLGHDAGDQLLRRVADTLRAHLRSYDLVVRFGGDEFVCGLVDLKMTDAAARLRLVNADLETTHHASVTFGLAELTANDSLAALVGRADHAMYEERMKRASSSK